MADFEVEPLSLEEEAYARSLDVADAQADAEFVKRPFRVISAAHQEVIAGYAEEDARIEAEYQAYLARKPAFRVTEHDPCHANYGEVYANPETERVRDAERVL